MKKLLMVITCLLVTACDNTEAISLSSSSNHSGSVEYSSEELLGKTVEEFEAFQAERKNKDDAKVEQKQPSSPEIKNGFLQLTWDNLVAPGYDADSILSKYEPLIDEIPHGSDAAIELYLKMEAEFNNAPANDNFADKKVSIPGFIAPLEQIDGVIIEFLLVPYFGACIHMPPPPANQTIYVRVAADYGINVEDAYNPIWVSGKLLIDKQSTDIGSASYQINEALVSAY